MPIPSFMLNQDLAGFLISLAGQSFLISLIGLAVLKVLSRRSAPVRSLVCTATIAALGLVLVIPFGYRLYDAGLAQYSITGFSERDITDRVIMPPPVSELSLPIESQPVVSHEPLPIEPLPVVSPAPFPYSSDMVIDQPVSESHSLSIPLKEQAIIFINALGLIWLLGVLFQVLRLGYGIIIVKRFRNNLKEIMDLSFIEMVSKVARTFQRDRIPGLYSSPLIESPITIGLFNPIVIIPEKLLNAIGENELQSILLHELAHIYHYDQVWGMIKRIVMALHWWNPFVYIINRHHEEAREEIADNYVLRELHPKVYTQCLVNLAEKVCLISSFPTAAGMAGRGFDLKARVERILSKKRSIAMGTKLHLKVLGFSICLVLTFGIAGIHARVKTVESNNGVKELQEPLQVINTVSITKEDQNLAQENVVKAEAVVKPENLRTIPNAGTATRKVMSGRQVQESEKPVMVVASVDMNAMNKTEKQMDSGNVQSLNKPALIKDPADNIALTQNETREDPDMNTITVPDNVVLNIRPEDAANDSNEEDIDTAIAELSRQIELNVSDAGLYVLRGNLHMDKQDYEQAVNDYTKAIEINPDDVAAYNNRGQAYSNMEEYKQAIKDYKKAIKIDPENIYAYINRGNAYHARRWYLSAISDFTRAIKIDSESSLAYINRGITYYQRRDFRKAVKDFSKAIELDDREAGTYLLRGNAYYSKSEYRQAINDYSKALEIAPDLINAYNNRGMAYEGMIEPEKAILDYSKAIKITSEDTDPYINRGRLYIQTGQLDNALSDFSKAIEINPDSYAAYIYRSEVYYMMGDMVESEHDKLMAVQLNPDLTIQSAKKEIQALLSARREPYRSIHVIDCVNCVQYEYDFKTIREEVQDMIREGRTNGYDSK